MLLPAFWRALNEDCAEVQDLKLHGSYIEGRVKQAEGYFKEVGHDSFAGTTNVVLLVLRTSCLMRHAMSRLLRG